MSTIEKEIPEGLRVYNFHHIENLDWNGSDDDAYANCPFCNGDKKFAINKETTKYRCFVCGVRGNEYSFVRNLWETADQDTDFADLVTNSRFLSGDACKEWGVRRHPLTNEWCIPSYNHEKKINNLYRFCNIKKKDGTWGPKLLPSPRLGHGLFGVNLYEEQKSMVALTEGWRDGIAVYETLKLHNPSGTSYLDEINVLSSPGVNSFKREWAPFFRKKILWILFDNDHPKENEKTGQEMLIGGVVGIKHVSSILKSLPEDDQPSAILYLAWGDNDGIGYSLELPSGLDIRDYLTTQNIH
jgi:hypothetical protein